MRRSGPKPGHLYVVATPIGNLSDLTERARAHPGLGRPGRLRGHAHDRRPARAASGLQPASWSPTTSTTRPRPPSAWPAVAAGAIGRAGDRRRHAGPERPGLPARAGLPQARACPSCPCPGPSAFAAVLSASGLPTNGFLFAGFLPAQVGGAARLLRQAPRLRLHDRPLRELPPDRQGRGRNRGRIWARPGSSASPRRSPSSTRPFWSARPARSAPASPRRASRASSRSSSPRGRSRSESPVPDLTGPVTRFQCPPANPCHPW